MVKAVIPRAAPRALNIMSRAVERHCMRATVKRERHLRKHRATLELYVRAFELLDKDGAEAERGHRPCRTAF